MSRVVESVHKVSPWRPLAVGVKNRFVVQPDDQRQSSPFILLVEDWIESDSAFFGMHPHRGFETVTLVLEGVERYRDHLGTEGLAHAGDVQWTCAGRGIFHGGEPEGDERLHVLQLWLNLPAGLKSAEPGTRLQALADTPTSDRTDAHVIVHAGMFEHLVQPHMSLWPLTLIEATLHAGGSVALDVDPSWRSFVYVLTGSIGIGAQEMRAGEVAWIGLDDAERDREVKIATVEGSHIVCYASPPIDEPVAMGGPFVMNTEEEIRQAYADLKNGVLVRQTP